MEEHARFLLGAADEPEGILHRGDDALKHIALHVERNKANEHISADIDQRNNFLERTDVPVSKNIDFDSFTFQENGVLPLNISAESLTN